MTIDQRVRALWQRTPHGPRTAFFACVITGLLVHLYAFTNLIPNSDGLSRLYDLQQMTISGRWFLHCASVFHSFTQMPMAIGLLSLLFLGLAAALTADLLGLDSRVLAGLGGAVMAAFPCLGYTFLYLFTASAYCFAILLAALSVWLARRGRLGWLLGICALALSMGTYQAYAAYAIGLSLAVVFRETLCPEAGFRGTLSLGLRLVGMLAAGAVLYYAVLLVFLRVKNLELLSYLGMDEASAGYPIEKLPGLILAAYKQVIAFFFLPSAHGFATAVMVTGNLLLLLSGLRCFLLRHKTLGWEPWRLAGGLAMLALLPLGINFGQILSPYAVPTPIMKYAFVLVYLAALVLLAQADGLSELGRGEVPAALAVMAILLGSFLNTNNLLYTASAQAHRATESYATRLLARIEDCPDYQPGMEIAIVGAVPQEQIMGGRAESFRRVEHYSVPAGTVLTLNKHIYYYLEQWLNFPVEELDEGTMKAIAASPAFQAMPLYPAQGSVQVLDGRVVVRMAQTYTPKSDYELAYENRR
ncbi:MAG: hypothetical protein HFF50_03020 [Lawsonibacter sp.]|nr:hypothetical protein [Lawsonibacter sp.]